MITKLRSISICMATLVLVVAFQNCGQIQISSEAPPPEVIQSKINLTAQGCVNSVKIDSEKTKFIFVIDLSRSNIGEFYKSKYLFNGAYYDGYNFFNGAIGTDTTGSRFDSISQFINTCGQSNNADYSIIGFSNNAGEIVKSGPNHILECKNRFTNSSGIQNQLDLMKDAQKTESKFYEKFKEPSNPLLSSHSAEMTPLLFKETNYIAATDCISSTIEQDLANSSNSTTNYQVFFLSDGEAKAKSSGCEEAGITDVVGCYTKKMDVKLNYLMKLSSAKAKPIRIHSMYYTASGNTNLKIESYMNYLSSIGQTITPINIGAFQNIKEGAENPFCKLLAVDRSITYRTNKIFAVNTNSSRVGPHVKKDTDMDGITDDDEIAYGSNTNSNRSVAEGVLDGVCRIIGNANLCRQQRSQITCDPLKINSFNISDCDIQILKLDKISYAPSLTGIDSDNDGIPDYIEILKGLSPINNDSYIDLDNDGLSNLQEINLGTDPFSPNINGGNAIESNIEFKEHIDSCTSGGWELNINALSGVQGNNHLLFYFRTESKNSQGIFEYRNFTTTYKYQKISDQRIDIELSEDLILSEQFKLVQP